jgi:hypothetical protein
LMGVATAAGSRALTHTVTFGLNLAIFTNLIQYLIYQVTV